MFVQTVDVSLPSKTTVKITGKRSTPVTKVFADGPLIKSNNAWSKNVASATTSQATFEDSEIRIATPESKSIRRSVLTLKADKPKFDLLQKRIASKGQILS